MSTSLIFASCLEVPKPAEIDPHGKEYTFDKLTKRLGRGKGFADVWKRHCFAWEYKGPRKNLVQAYAQLKQYADDLGNPPLLIVSDMREIRIHTNFTNTVAKQHVIELRRARARSRPGKCCVPASSTRKSCGRRRPARASPPKPPPIRRHRRAAAPTA